MNEKVRQLKNYLSQYRHARTADKISQYRNIIENLLLDELDRADTAERELAALRERYRWVPVSEQKYPDPEDSNNWSLRIYNGELYWAWLPPEPPEDDKIEFDQLLDDHESPAWDDDPGIW